jgi:hypothetical protein
MEKNICSLKLGGLANWRDPESNGDARCRAHLAPSCLFDVNLGLGRLRG